MLWVGCSEDFHKSGLSQPRPWEQQHCVPLCVYLFCWQLAGAHIMSNHTSVSALTCKKEQLRFQGMPQLTTTMGWIT